MILPPRPLQYPFCNKVLDPPYLRILYRNQSFHTSSISRSAMREPISSIICHIFLDRKRTVILSCTRLTFADSPVIGSLVHRMMKSASSDICQVHYPYYQSPSSWLICLDSFPLVFPCITQTFTHSEPCYTSFLPIPSPYWTVQQSCAALLIPIFDYYPYYSAMTHTFPICLLFPVLFLLVTIPIFPIGSSPLST